MNLPYDVIDIERLKASYDKPNLNIKFYLAITAVVKNSYTNAFSLYNCVIEDNYRTLSLNPIDTLSATILRRDSYYVTKLLGIPNTNLMVAVIEDFGMQIINASSLYYQRSDNPSFVNVLADINFESYIEFYD